MDQTTTILQSGQMLCHVCEGTKQACSECWNPEVACQEKPAGHPFVAEDCFWCEGTGIEPAEGVNRVQNI
jgi:hypothetical protein